MNASDVVDDIDSSSNTDTIYHSLHDTLDESPLPVPAAVSPTSDVEAIYSIPEPDSLILKDQRSHERARQRLKKAGDISKGKRCVKCSHCKPWKWAGNGGRLKTMGRGLRAAFMEGEGECRVGLEHAMDSSEDDRLYVARTSARDASLVDFIKAPLKGRDKRFEIIARPRQVLVLDDFTETDPPKFDHEEWEYVDLEDNHRKATARSYARVVASQA